MLKKLGGIALPILLALSLATPAFANGDITHVVSAWLEYGPNGWGGWSCPLGLVVVDAGIQDNDHAVAQALVWKPGASVDGYTYPTTPFGYVYAEGEEGYIVQNNNVGQSLRIWLDCAPPAPPATGGGAEVVFSAWLGTADDGSWCALASPLPFVGIEVQQALCFPVTNPTWVATNAPCYGPVYSDNRWVCDYLIGGPGNRLNVWDWLDNIHNYTP